MNIDKASDLVRAIISYRFSGLVKAFQQQGITDPTLLKFMYTEEIDRDVSAALKNFVETEGRLPECPYDWLEGVFGYARNWPWDVPSIEELYNMAFLIESLYVTVTDTTIRHSDGISLPLDVVYTLISRETYEYLEIGSEEQCMLDTEVTSWLYVSAFLTYREYLIREGEARLDDSWSSSIISPNRDVENLMEMLCVHARQNGR